MTVKRNKMGGIRIRTHFYGQHQLEIESERIYITERGDQRTHNLNIGYHRRHFVVQVK